MKSEWIGSSKFPPAVKRTLDSPLFYLILTGFGVATISGMAISFVIDANENAFLIGSIRVGFAIVLSQSLALLTWQMIGSRYLALAVFAIVLAVCVVWTIQTNNRSIRVSSTNVASRVCFATPAFQNPGGWEHRGSIIEGDSRQIEAADAILAKITPFRGPNMDPGAARATG